jgi:hypothetical protein
MAGIQILTFKTYGCRTEDFRHDKNRVVIPAGFLAGIQLLTFKTYGCRIEDFRHDKNRVVIPAVFWPESRF